MVFATAIEQLGRDQVLPTKIWCDDPTSTWNKGYTILNFMKNVSKIMIIDSNISQIDDSSFQIKYDGLTGRIEFDNAGLRSNITVELLELGEMELVPVGAWMFGMDNPDDRLKISRTVKEPPKDDTIDNSLKNKTLTVITALVIPVYFI